MVVIAHQHMQDALLNGPFAVGAMDEVPLRGGDVPQEHGELICHLAALRHPHLGVVDDIQGGGAEKPLSHLLALPSGGHDHIEVPRVEALLDIPAVYLHSRKSGVQRKAHAVIDALKTDFRH